MKLFIPKYLTFFLFIVFSKSAFSQSPFESYLQDYVSLVNAYLDPSNSFQDREDLKREIISWYVDGEKSVVYNHFRSDGSEYITIQTYLENLIADYGQGTTVDIDILVVDYDYTESKAVVEVNLLLDEKLSGHLGFGIDVWTQSKDRISGKIIGFYYITAEGMMTEVVGGMEDQSESKRHIKSKAEAASLVERERKKKIEQEAAERKRKKEESKPKLHPEVSKIERNMVRVQGGSFTMGCTSEQSDCEGDESPAHQVQLSTYYISKYEVTQSQWQAVMGINPSRFSNCGQCPVEQVSWDNIQEFISKLNSLTGQQYRLPTEAEWEYAARGGSKSQGYQYAGSNDIGSIAWYKDNSGSKTQKVGGKNGNELGLYDMSGNVSEWCSDWYDGDYYTNSPRSNPQGPRSGAEGVLRGGSWGNIDRLCRVSYRSWYYPSNSNSYLIGFRLSRTP